MDALLEANGTFALTLLKKLGEDNSKNVFISPLSISSALAMVFMGARGNTAAQMSQVHSGSRFWAVAYGISLAGEPVSAIQILEALLNRQASLPICPVPGPAGQCLSGWWPEAPACAEPDSRRTGLNEQAFIEPLLRPAAQGPVGPSPSCQDAQSQPWAGCTARPDASPDPKPWPVCAETGGLSAGPVCRQTESTGHWALQGAFLCPPSLSDPHRRQAGVLPEALCLYLGESCFKLR